MNSRIYLEDVDSLGEFELPENTYVNAEIMHNVSESLKYKLESIFGTQDKLIENAKSVIIARCKLGKPYALISFKGYYGLVQILDDFEPREISNEIYCFDSENIYPTQKKKQRPLKK